MAQGLTSSAASVPQSNALTAYLGGKQWQSKWNSYFSRVRLTSTSAVATGSTNSYVIAAGAEVTAFAYNRNQDMAAAGLPGVVSTPADTNITTPSQTISSEAVEIMGISLIVLGQSDAQLLKALDQCVSVRLKMNATQEYLLGIPSMLPSAGGLFGSAEAQSGAPALPDQVSRTFGMMSHGVPYISNYFPFPETMMWVAAGRGDSNLNVILKVERQAATIPTFGSPTRAAATGVAPYLAPGFASVWVDYMVVLVGRTVNELSSN